MEFDTKGVAPNRLERRWRSQLVFTANLVLLLADAVKRFVGAKQQLIVVDDNGSVGT